MAAVLARQGLQANVQRADDRDTWLYLLLGSEVAHGARPYVEAWDIKPPGIMWVNALATATLGTGDLAFEIVGGITAVAGVALLAVVAHQLHRGFARTAVYVGAIYLLYYPFRVGSDRPDTFVVVADLACAALALRGLRANSPGLWLAAAGAIGGISFVFKQTGLAMPLAVAGWLTWRLYHDAVSRRGTLLRIGTFAAGWIFTVGGAAAVLLVQGSGSAAWESIFVLPAQQLRTHGGGASMWRWLQQNGRDLRPLVALAAAALSCHSLKPLRRAARIEAECSDRVTFPADWLAAALLLAMVSPHARDWYLAPVLAPLILLAIEGIRCVAALAAMAWRKESRWGIAVAGVALVLLLHWTYEGVRGQFAAAHRAERQRFHATQEDSARQLIAAIVRHSGPDDRLFVFGYRPELYLRSQRRMAIRFAGTQEATTWCDPRNGLLNTVFAELRAQPPAVLIGDPPPTRADRPEEQDRAAEFAEWRARFYELAEPEVWVRRAEEIHP